MTLINVSIDDVSPHPRAGTGVLRACERVLESVPSVKFTLFVPVAYWRTLGAEATETPLYIGDYPEFCRELCDLPRETFEVCYHGLYHGIPRVSNNDEFRDLTEEQARERLSTMVDLADRACRGLFKKIVRPPAWRMSEGSIRAARALGFETLALARFDYALATYAGADTEKKDTVYATCSPPFQPLELVEKTEIVYHSCEWDRSYLSLQMSEELIEFLTRAMISGAQCRFIEDLRQS